MFIVTAQTGKVGIGTNNPQADLHVAGDMLIQTELKLNSIPKVTATDDNFKIITRATTTTPVGEVTQLNVDILPIAPINVVDYHFTNIRRDNLTNVNLQYPTSAFVVGIANFRYTGAGIDKVGYFDSTSGTNRTSIGQFVVRTFEQAGQWHLEIRNRTLDVASSGTIEYYITIVVYNNVFFRNLPVITTTMNGNLDGTTSTIPVLIN